MNVKTMLLTGALALILISCVITAGCTSDTTQQIQSADTASCPWVGYWTSEYKHPDESVTTVSMGVKSDGTAEWAVINDETWEQTGDTTFTLTNPVNGITYAYTYDSVKDSLTQTVNGVTNTYTRQTPAFGTASCPWIGYWTSEYKNPNDSVTVISMAIKSDGTVKWAVINEETWKQTGDTTFTLTNPVTGSSFEYVYDTAKDTLTETVNGITNVYTRIDPILGTWGTLCKENEMGIKITTFFANGTGKDTMFFLNGDVIDSAFTWEKTGINTYNLIFDTGNIREVKISDRELDWKIITLNDQILGTHTSTYEEDGNTITCVTTFNDDYTGTAVCTPVTSPDTEPVNENFTWNKTGHNTYILNFKSGNKWLAEYTTEPDKTVAFTRYNYADDPIVGTHEEKMTGGKKDGVLVSTYKANGDGTGILTTDTDTTTYNFFWEKINTNLYKILYFNKNSLEYWIESYNPQTSTFTSDLHGCQWTENYRLGGKHVLDIQITNYNNGSSWEYDDEGISKHYTTTWEKSEENIFKITYDDGEVWTATYLPVLDTFVWKKDVQ